jgi:uncharacterized Rossmann fold enzyme
MQLLSDDYKKTIQEYHAQSQRWGSGSYRWIAQVSEIVEDGDTLLDYGCGKGTFAATAPWPVAEYDPGIPGKDGEPEPADVVVCTDVLEHIEPEFIDKVIGHIYTLTKKVAFLTIAMRPANAILPDGRNAHLIIEGLDWWKAKLAPYFSFDGVVSATGEATFVVRPIRELKEIPAKGAIDDAVRGEQMAACLARGLPRLGIGTVKGGKVALLCYGPSLNSELPAIRSLYHSGVPIVTCSGAHDWMLDNGMVPYAHCDIDGRPHKSLLVKEPHASTKYWMASVCHPDYFDKLEGFDVSWFHIMNTDETVEWVKTNDPGGWLLTGGLTVGNRLLGLLHHMGYSEIDVFGMDCSYEDGKRHAGGHTGKVQKPMEIRCGDRWFTSSAQMICAARNIIDSLDHMRAACDVTFHGDGLLQAMIRKATGLCGIEAIDEKKAA